MGKVVHVSDELHEKLRRLSEKEGVGLKEFAERLFEDYIEGRKPIPPIPVPKKKLETFNAEQRRGPDPYELPPFWSGRKRVERHAVEEKDQLEEESGGPGGGAGGGKEEVGRAHGADAVTWD